MKNARGISITMRQLTILLVLALAAGAALPGTSLPAAMADVATAPAPRLAIPDAAAQAKTEKLIRDIFGNYAATPLAERSALAAKLIDQGMASADDPVARFVLLKDGADLAASGGDAVTAMRGATLLASMYAVDEGELKLALLRRAANAATGPSYAAAVASEGLNCANEAVAAGNYDLASRLILTSEQAAHTAKNLTLMLSVQSRAADIKWLVQESTRAKTAEEKLNKSPADPDANHTLGRFFCLVRGDWAHGLVGLSKGSNPAYQAAATADLANPTTSDKQVAAGDLWWDLAEKETAGAAQKSLRRRAGYWYAQAATNPQLTGLRRALVEKKLGQVPLPGPGEAVAEVPPAVPAPAVPPPAVQPPAVPPPAVQPTPGNIFSDAPAAAGGATIGQILPHALLVLCFEENDFYRVGSDTFIRDLSGHDNKVEVHGATICDGRAGKGLHFDGKSWVDISGSYPEGAKPRTIVAWAKIDAGHDSGMLLNYGLVKPGAWFGASFNLKQGWRLVDAIGGPMANLKVDSLWHHHCLVYTGTELQYYVDGKLASTVSRNEQTAPQPMRLAARTDQGDFFTGTIDEVAVFDTALSAADVQAVYDRGTLGQPLVRGSSAPSPPPVQPTAVQAPAVPPPAVQPPAFTPASGNLVDLLRLIDVSKDAVGGKWKPEEAGIRSSDEYAARLRIAYDPPAEYDMRMIFTVHSDATLEKGYVGMLLAHGNATFLWEMEPANGKCFFEGNHVAAEHAGMSQFAGGSKHEVIVSVRNQSVKAFIDGKLASQFTPDYSRMSASDYWTIGDHAVGITSHRGEVTFHSIVLAEISGRGIALPRHEAGPAAGRSNAQPNPAPTPASNPPAPPLGPDPAARANLTADQWAIASGLFFSEFGPFLAHEGTYTRCRIVVDNRSAVSQVENKVRARIRLLCMNGDGKPRVLEYSDDLKIGIKGTKEFFLSGMVNKDVRYNNADDWKPHNAHILIEFDGVQIYETLWRPANETGGWHGERTASNAGHEASNTPDGAGSSNHAILSRDQWAIASALVFSDFNIPVEHEGTYTKGRISVDNRSAVAQVENKIRARIRLLCVNADGKPSVLEYWEPVRIPVKGQQEVAFSGLGNKEIKANNNGDWKPRNAHILIEFEGVPMYEALWKPASETGGWRGEMPGEKPASTAVPPAPAAKPPASGINGSIFGDTDVKKQ